MQYQAYKRRSYHFVHEPLVFGRAPSAVRFALQFFLFSVKFLKLILSQGLGRL